MSYSPFILGLTDVGQSQASKFLVADGTGNFEFQDDDKIIFGDGADASISWNAAGSKVKAFSENVALELGHASSTTTILGNLVISGTTTTVDVEVVNTANGVVFEGSTDNDYETTLLCVDPTADRAVNLADSAGTLVPFAAVPSAGVQITSTPAELNILDGVTSTAAELNILDGVTSTYAELNILDGVTSTAAELNILDGVTATASELNYLDGAGPAHGYGGEAFAGKAVVLDGSKNISTIGTIGCGAITSTGSSSFGATSFGDNDITNVGNIALDSITADGSTITITGNTTFADGAYDFDIASHDTSNGLKLGGTLVTATAAELNILDGVTSTAAELNILDGVTSTAAELNILDGVTSTAVELNILDGVTATAADLNILVGVTSSNNELNILDGVTATAAELNILDGVTSTTAELNLLDGVTSLPSAAELDYLDITTLGTAEASKAVTVSAASKITLGSIEIEGSAFDINGGTIDGVAGSFTTLDCNDGAFAIANLDIDGGSDLDEAIMDHDLFIIDNVAGGMGGTNRKCAASRLRTYLLPVLQDQTDVASGGTVHDDSGVTLIDTGGSNYTVYLPSSPTAGKTYTIKKTDSAVNTLTVARAGLPKIDDALSVVLYHQYESVTVVSDGSDYHII